MVCELEQVEVYLPEVVKEIVVLIGISATEKLVKAFGGVGFYLGARGDFFEKIKNEIGESAAQKLANYFNGYLYLPKCDVALRVLRNRQLYADFVALTTQEKKTGRAAMLELCKKYRLSDRQGWDIVYSLRSSVTKTQAALF